MVFKKMLRVFGVGGPGVDTVLDRAQVRPGETLTGTVHVKGGDHEVAIEGVGLGLVARVEVESGQGEFGAVGEFARLDVCGPFRLAAGEPRDIPFAFPVPFEAPVTHVGGRSLRGMTLGVRTELAVAKAVDKGDLDVFEVHPLPSQERVLDAFAELGFAFKHADLESGRIHGLRQELPFYQEIEWRPPAELAGRIGEVELTFVADPHHLSVVLEADRRGGVFGGGGDAFGRWAFPHEVALRTDWEGEVGRWLSELAARSAHHGGHGHHHGGHSRHGGGGMVAGAAAGLVGGMVLGEVFDEAGDAFFGDEG
ncbi:sporulation protein [Phytomonospora sp. NPDC050363]|uniref:sporulation protein n=1 Tax=Phytomonospora sp. NPDC050363 TaxID=3155642 RepID=UPI0033EE125F